MAVLCSPGTRPAGPYPCAVYGLGIRSAVPLRGAVRHHGVADVAIRPEPLPQVTAGLVERGAHTRVAPGETHLHLPRIGTFLIRSGSEILVDAHPEVDDELLQLVILGPVLAALLQQRGCLVLHASAVEMGGAAVGFLGVRGAGKSTTAAALCARGYPLLADDMLAVWLDGDEPRVARGLPQLKLWPDSVRALGGDPDLLPSIHGMAGKRAQWIDGGSGGPSELPLARLYVLCGGRAIRIDRLPPRQAFLHVLAHSYGIEWLHETSGPEQFCHRAELVRRSPVRLLQRPPDLELVSRLACLVEEDLGSD
jgi:hypothetical protein